MFLALCDAVGREGGRGVAIDSFGAVSLHTGTNDCLILRLLFFTWWDPAGLMPWRVAAEVVIAAGLGKMCVANSPDGELTLIVDYQRDKLLQMRLNEFFGEQPGE